MGLSCSCPDWEGEPGDWAYYPPDDFTIFTGIGKKKRRARCSSCKKLIDIGTECLEFGRIRAPYTEMEQRISGDEIPIASLWQCADCGEQYLNLNAIGYCMSPTDDMRECLKEYHLISGFSPSVVS